MIDEQAVVSLSPVRSDFFPPLDKGSWDTRRRSAFGSLTRHLTSTFSRVALTEDCVRAPVCTEASLHQIKLKIFAMNPLFYQLFRETLINNKCYTHYSACFFLQQFLNETLRIPEIRDDIINHRLVNEKRPPRTGSLFAYLMVSESTLSTMQAKRFDSTTASLKSLSPNSVKQTIYESLASCSLSLPSLDSTVSQIECEEDALHEDTDSCASSESMSSC